MAFEPLILPEMVIVTVLRHLSLKDRATAARIDKVWHAASQHPSLWENIDLSVPDMSQLTDTALRSLLASRRVVRLKLRSCMELTDSGISSALTGLQHPEALTFLDCRSTAAGPVLAATLHESPKLAERLMLDIRGCTAFPLLMPKCSGLIGLRAGWDTEAKAQTWISESVADRFRRSSSLIPGLADIATKMRHLRKIEFHGLQGTTAELVAAVGSWPYLESFALTVAHGPAVPAAVRVLSSYCPRLLSINLRCCSTVDDSALRAIATGLPALKRLNLSCCNRISDHGLSFVLRACMNLEALDVCYASSLTMASIRLAVEVLPNLVDLGASGFTEMTDADITTICQQAPSLAAAGFGGCPGLTDMALDTVAKMLSGTLTSVVMHQLNVSLAAVVSMVEACPRLVYLDIDSCAGDGFCAAAETPDKDARETLVRAATKARQGCWPLVFGFREDIW